MQQVRAVVAKAKGAPVEVVTINVPDPGPGEAVVQVQACGVCHTDLHYREGGINDDFPFLLGHEAAGIVEAVGEGVTEVAPGDFVVLNWRAVCGDCRACNRGEPWYCFATHTATQKMTLEDGTELSPALGIGAFAEKTLVAAGQCTKVDEAGHHAAAEEAGDLGGDGRIDLGALAGGDQGLLGEGADAEGRGELRAVEQGHPLLGVVGGEAVPGATAAAGAALAADGPPVEDHVVAGGDVGDALADRLDGAGGLVAQQEGEVVVDPALLVVQVGVADAARLDPYDGLAGAGIGDDDRLDPHRLVPPGGDDPPHVLWHR